jgi:hypothetical protein
MINAQPEIDTRSYTERFPRGVGASLVGFRQATVLAMKLDAS